jgi:hypothetical protein
MTEAIEKKQTAAVDAQAAQFDQVFAQAKLGFDTAFCKGLQSWVDYSVEASRQSRDSIAAQMVELAASDNMAALVNSCPGFVKMLMRAQGTGFKTDRDRDGGYQQSVVVRCFLDAAAQGLPATHNCWNIIGGNMYVTISGCKLKLDRMGVAYECTPLPPVATRTEPGHKENSVRTIVTEPVELSWVDTQGNKGRKTLTFEIIQNAGMGQDAVMGKATRKALAWLIEHLTHFALPEGEVADITPAAPRVSPLEQPRPTAGALPAASSVGDLGAAVLGAELQKLGSQHSVADVLEFVRGQGKPVVTDADVRVLKAQLPTVLENMERVAKEAV